MKKGRGHFFHWCSSCLSKDPYYALSWSMFSTLSLLFIFFHYLSLPTFLTPTVLSLGLYPGSPGGKKWYFYSQGASPWQLTTKWFVTLALEEAQRGWMLCAPWPTVTWLTPSPTALEAKEGVCWTLEEGDGSGIHRDCYMGNGTGKVTAGVCGRELVTEVGGQRRTISVWGASPRTPWTRIPLPMFI